MARTVHLYRGRPGSPPYPGRLPADSPGETICGLAVARRTAAPVDGGRGFADCGACIAALATPTPRKLDAHRAPWSRSRLACANCRRRDVHPTNRLHFRVVFVPSGTACVYCAVCSHRRADESPLRSSCALPRAVRS